MLKILHSLRTVMLSFTLLITFVSFSTAQVYENPEKQVVEAALQYAHKNYLDHIPSDSLAIDRQEIDATAPRAIANVDQFAQGLSQSLGMPLMSADEAITCVRRRRLPDECTFVDQIKGIMAPHFPQITNDEAVAFIEWATNHAHSELRLQLTRDSEGNWEVSKVLYYGTS